MKRVPIVFLIIAIVLLISIAVINHAKESAPARQVKPVIAASIFPLFDIVRNVAGDSFDVKLILPPGASPHIFEPTSQTVKDIEKADKIFVIGHGIDNWAQKIASDSSKVVVVDKGIDLLASNDVEEDGPIDPHYWLSIKNSIIIAKNIAEELKSNYPDKSEFITSKLDSYTKQLEKADVDIRNILVSTTNRSLITFHDAWYYFAKEYGFQIVGTFEPTAGREPTPQYLAKLSDTIRKSDVHILYSEPQFSTRNIEPFASDYDIKIEVVDPEGSGKVNSYIDLMYGNARVFAQNK